ncbi:hypothetical protein P0O24_12430 [Methanotrichaceae archaeon M04Ac]|uniref:Uncharacterized protein n=1 Tax=Candidatus Methanocrinis alkalitolerans TaxID=3033395 RepID=A0ABT5XI34_9EURY|nr:hypothetical protein [Candidatus Methanocrinis alkalitolerans]
MRYHRTTGENLVVVGKGRNIHQNGPTSTTTGFSGILLLRETPPAIAFVRVYKLRAR